MSPLVLPGVIDVDALADSVSPQLIVKSEPSPDLIPQAKTTVAPKSDPASPQSASTRFDVDTPAKKPDVDSKKDDEPDASGGPSRNDADI